MEKEEIRAADFSTEAEMLKVLGHPVRLKIVVGLTANACCVKDIWECMDLPQPVVSQHLAVLKSRGVVEAKREGKKMLYSVCSPFAKKVARSLVSSMG
ncbi:MAG: winged helix-turn-helix transcriptional regulator [Proteobacteria bacterium]|nr:winged helix-turn-helix transcriptional regulator [Pseudomonadota bacterium]